MREGKEGGEVVKAGEKRKLHWMKELQQDGNSERRQCGKKPTKHINVRKAGARGGQLDGSKKKPKSVNEKKGICREHERGVGVASGSKKDTKKKHRERERGKKRPLL